MAKNDTLTPRQRAAIAALLAAPTIGEAAQQAGVSERQLHRWLRDAIFTAELRTAQAEIIAGMVRRLLSLAEGNFSTLAEIRDTGSEAQRLQAAKTLDGALFRWYEMGDIVRRIENLERTLTDDTTPNA